MGMALNIAAKQSQQDGGLQSISLPREAGQNLLNQFANDMNFMIQGDYNNFLCLLNMIDQFGLTSSFFMNCQRAWHTLYSQIPLPLAGQISWRSSLVHRLD
jgi:hypothetical protein